MRILDVRRHTMRRKPGDHLSREGIKLARMVGDESPNYDLVVTSTVPRAIETAIAMGFEVNLLKAELGEIAPEVLAETGFPATFAQASQTMADKEIVARFAQTQSRLWQDVVEQLPKGGRGLIITHGLFVEMGAVALLPKADRRAWGGPIGYCEGLRVHWHDGPLNSEVLRVPPAYRLVEN